MIIKSLAVSNIGPFYGEQKVEFGTGLISIEGRYTDKPGESNRAGKTALIDLIRFGLYGVHRHRNVASYVNRKANKRNDLIYLSIELEDEEQGSIHIIREFDPAKQTFAIRIPDREDTFGLKQAEIQQYIENNILSCSYENARRTWLVLQNEALGIMDMSVADRKNFLLETFSSQKAYPWDSYYVEVSSRLNGIKTRQSALLSRINNLTNRLAEMDTFDFQASIATQKKKILQLQERRDQLRDSLKDLEMLASPEAIEALRADLKREKQKEVTLYNATLMSQKTNEKLHRDRQSLSIKTQTLAELQNSRKNLQSKLDKSNNVQVEAEYTVVYDRHKEQSTLLAQNLKLFDSLRKFKGVCPVTHQECEAGADIDTFRTTLEQDISKRTREVDGLQVRLDELAVQMEVYDKLKKDMAVVESNIQATTIALEHLQDADKLYQEHRQKMEQEALEYEEQKKKVAGMEAELKARTVQFDLTYQRRIREVKQEQSTISIQIEETQKRIETLLADQSRKEVFESDLKDATAEFEKLELRVQSLQALKPMLSPSGIPFMYLLASIADFEISINKALSSLGTDLTVNIEPYTYTTTLAPICSVCGYEFPKKSNVTHCLNPLCGAKREYNRRETLEMKLIGRVFDVNFDEDSGGGQQWISMGVRFALFNALKERGLMGSINFWSLDEVFAPLSEPAKAAMLNKLDSVLDEYGIKQLFIITHTDISEIIPPSIIIERSEALQESHIVS